MLRFLRELTPEERRVILQIYPDITTWQQFAAAPAPSSQERAGSAAPDDNSPAHTYKSTAVTTSSVTATPSATTAPSVTTAPSATAGPVTGSAVTVPIAAAVALPVGGTQHPLAVTAPVTSQSRSAFPGTVVNAGYERTAKTTVPLSTSNTDTTVTSSQRVRRARMSRPLSSWRNISRDIRRHSCSNSSSKRVQCQCSRRFRNQCWLSVRLLAATPPIAFIMHTTFTCALRSSVVESCTSTSIWKSIGTRPAVMLRRVPTTNRAAAT